MTPNGPPPPSGRSSPRRALDAAGDALRFFTRLPVPSAWSTPQPERIFDGVAAAAPLAGAVAGAVAGEALGAGLALGLPALPAAAFAVIAGVALTGALHQDALADVADGFGGGATRKRKLEIMRDSSVGAYGVSALTLALGARITLVAALAERLGEEGALLALIAAAALSRPLALLPALLLKPARADGAGRAARPRAASVAVGCGLGALAALLLAGVGAGLAAAAAAAVAALGVTALSRAQIRGYTGDVCGAATEVAEIAALVALVAAAAG
ncbi:adenosylcobinamide-GDP ribazoletransferase [Hansschlegelia beijingensis]|uniref:Adenosylcobinamide-GDP ribazoletransferase n=1 Tax=Hansschlegelia beijingensis TaxID=1133344 RepID=A0A7W6D0T6_9HYPH|nr:adenosylcobinamide-GDP ribazoletransferase [Hansschlegelia beijingensis]MBB3973794.1 adenosylcobinamide-GDP ribazoletransferase [Hansschlegelia beijingensis]